MFHVSPRAQFTCISPWWWWWTMEYSGQLLVIIIIILVNMSSNVLQEGSSLGKKGHIFCPFLLRWWLCFLSHMEMEHREYSGKGIAPLYCNGDVVCGCWQEEWDREPREENWKSNKQDPRWRRIFLNVSLAAAAVGWLVGYCINNWIENEWMNQVIYKLFSVHPGRTRALAKQIRHSLAQGSRNEVR